MIVLISFELRAMPAFLAQAASLDRRER